MKVRIILEHINFYPKIGGIQTYLLNIGKELIKGGHEVIVLTRNPKNELKHLERYKRIKIVRYPTKSSPNKKNRLLEEQVEIEKQLKKIKAEKKIDLIICRASIYTKPNIKSVGKEKTIYIAPSVIKNYLKNIKSLEDHSIDIKLEKETLEKSGKIITLSENVKKQIIKDYKIPKEKVVVIKPGFDSRRFKRSNYKKKAAVILSRLSPEKNVITVIKAFDKIGGKLKIIGGGELEEELKRETLERSLQNRITFMGWKKNPERYMQDARVLILPSTYEGFGLVLLEAMASGLPCVAFKPDGKKIVTASAEIIVDGKTGYLVKDEKELAEKITKLLENTKLCRKMGSEAIIEAKKYNWSKTAKDIVSLCESSKIPI